MPRIACLFLHFIGIWASWYSGDAHSCLTFVTKSRWWVRCCKCRLWILDKSSTALTTDLWALSINSFFCTQCISQVKSLDCVTKCAFIGTVNTPINKINVSCCFTFAVWCTHPEFRRSHWESWLSSWYIIIAIHTFQPILCSASVLKWHCFWLFHAKSQNRGDEQHSIGFAKSQVWTMPKCIHLCVCTQ